METSARMYQDLERVLITRAEISARVHALGAQIQQDYEGKELVMIGILKGAVVFFTDLLRVIDLPVTMDFIATTSYGSATQSSGEVRIVKDLDNAISGKDVLIVEDIIDSGLTLSKLKDMLGSRGALSIKICALLDKPSRRKVRLSPDYSGFEIADQFVVGYGLDYAERYRNLPDIGVLKPAVYTE